MIDAWLSDWLHWLGGEPCFRIYGKGRREKKWRTIDVFATWRRNHDSPLPLFRGTCITWTSKVIVVGWDFAKELLDEQRLDPAARDYPVAVAGSRLHDPFKRHTAGEDLFASASEVMAHECGHTWQ